MGRRVLSVWLPRLPVERLARRGVGGRLFVVVSGERGRQTVVAADPAAEDAGIAPGMALADARAVLPGLRAAESEPEADARALDGLADWCGRYTPRVGLDPPDGLLLDVTGCAHLFGGETGLLADLAGRLRGFGYSCRLALADTPSAAAALARFGPEHVLRVPPGGGKAALAGLPMAALRLPAETTALLRRLGLRRIGDLYPLPRAPLARRLGAAVVRRLDQALGLAAEPVSPRRPVPAHEARLAFAEPISERRSIEEALGRLLGRLCAGLERAGQGARRLDLACFGTDGRVGRLSIGTSRPSRDPTHLARLFAERLGRLEPGHGFEVMSLLAAAEPLSAVQIALAGSGAGEGAPPDLAELVDRLGNRLGLDSVRCLLPRESWWPERAVAPVPAPVPPRLSVRAWPADRPRPVRLLARPEPVEVTAPVPDDPPVMFRWQGRVHRVRRADGPERIEPEWWFEAGEMRDYYRVEDTEGARFWIYRAGLHHPGRPARWFLHGMFA
jgi:protein ImuB